MRQRAGSCQGLGRRFRFLQFSPFFYFELVILILILIRLQHVCTCQKFAKHAPARQSSIQELRTPSGGSSASPNCLKVNAACHTPIYHTPGNLSIFPLPFDWHAINISPTAISTANFVNNVSPAPSGINLSTCPGEGEVMHNSQTSPQAK